MNISYNWLKEYIDFNLTPEELGAALTSLGLECGTIDRTQLRKANRYFADKFEATMRIFV